MPRNFVRIVIAAIVGSVIMFGWGAFVHMVLIGHDDYKQIANEAGVRDALRFGNPADGAYWLPWMDEAKMNDPAAMKAYEAEVQKGPVALIVYQHSLESVMPPSMLMREYFSNLAACLVLAIVLSCVQWPPMKSAGMLALLALAYWFSNNVSYCIWYGFPGSWIRGELIEQVGAWVLVGCAMAAIVRKSRAASH